MTKLLIALTFISLAYGTSLSTVNYPAQAVNQQAQYPSSSQSVSSTNITEDGRSLYINETARFPTKSEVDFIKSMSTSIASGKPSEPIPERPLGEVIQQARTAIDKLNQVSANNPNRKYSKEDSNFVSSLLGLMLRSPQTASKVLAESSLKAPSQSSSSSGFQSSIAQSQSAIARPMESNFAIPSLNLTPRYLPVGQAKSLSQASITPMSAVAQSSDGMSSMSSISSLNNIPPVKKSNLVGTAQMLGASAGSSFGAQSAVAAPSSIAVSTQNSNGLAQAAVGQKFLRSLQPEVTWASSAQSSGVQSYQSKNLNGYNSNGVSTNNIILKPQAVAQRSVIPNVPIAQSAQSAQSAQTAQSAINYSAGSNGQKSKTVNGNGQSSYSFNNGNSFSTNQNFNSPQTPTTLAQNSVPIQNYNQPKAPLGQTANFSFQSSSIQKAPSTPTNISPYANGNLIRSTIAQNSYVPRPSNTQAKNSQNLAKQQKPNGVNVNYNQKVSKQTYSGIQKTPSKSSNQVAPQVGGTTSYIRNTNNPVTYTNGYQRQSGNNLNLNNFNNSLANRQNTNRSVNPTNNWNTNNYAQTSKFFNVVPATLKPKNITKKTNFTRVKINNNQKGNALAKTSGAQSSNLKINNSIASAAQNIVLSANSLSQALSKPLNVQYNQKLAGPAVIIPLSFAPSTSTVSCFWCKK